MKTRNKLVIAGASLAITIGTISIADASAQSCANDEKASSMHCGHVDNSGTASPLAGNVDQTARIDDAQRLIDKNQAFQLRAKQFHAAAETQIDEAKRLTGKAEQLQRQRQGLSMMGKVDRRQLQAAVDQYNIDLNTFRMHADEYADHLHRFRSQVGECHDNEAEYRANLAEYTLHCNKFHMPNIVAPHICGMLGLSLRETEMIANQLKTDKFRMVSAESDLRQQENKLIGSLLEEPSLMAKAQSANSRAYEEQKIAGEFARLAEEYKTLAIEHKFVTGEPSPPSTTVHARVKRSH